MKILLLNPPHPSIGSRIPREHLPPLGLLALGGPLLDAGHRVRLLDADLGPMSLVQIVSTARDYQPDAVLLGHSGSTSGHPAASRIVQAVRKSLPHTWILYGGVFPTYHWQQIMQLEFGIDFIVRGEGECQRRREGESKLAFWNWIICWQATCCDPAGCLLDVLVT
jgi:anaerobic magnesium-protoporphyrin IX monomethyl ester cyclase